MQNLTQTEIKNELNKLMKKAVALSKKAYCGNDHSSLYSSRMTNVYDKIYALKAQLTN